MSALPRTDPGVVASIKEKKKPTLRVNFVALSGKRICCAPQLVHPPSADTLNPILDCYLSLSLLW